MSRVTVYRLAPGDAEKIQFSNENQAVRDFLEKSVRLPDARIYAAVTEDGQVVALGGLWKFNFIFGEWGLCLLAGSERYLLSIYRACWGLIDKEAREMGVWCLCALIVAGAEKERRFCEAFGFLQFMGPGGLSVLEVDGQKAEIFLRSVTGE